MIILKCDFMFNDEEYKHECEKIFMLSIQNSEGEIENIIVMPYCFSLVKQKYVSSEDGADMRGEKNDSN